MNLSWEFPEFDEHIFEAGKSKRFAKLTYTSSEIDKMIEFLIDFTSTHPICIPVLQLLYAAHTFLSATLQEQNFVAMGKNKKEKEIKNILDEIATELKIAQDNANALDKSSAEYKFLSSAITYCKESISRRIDEMKLNKDPMYNHYQNSTLQKIIMSA